MCIPSRHGCGNGIIEKGEQCDDGNNADGDGCSAHCARENGFECRGASHSFCHPAGYWN
jgi:cysteine-rich repeat protein